ncbi:MAG: class I SAM-dependent methyltransferase [Acidobacteriota bacterium]
MRIVEALGLILLVIGTGVLWWRRASRRRSLPCPTWLAWSLQGPLMDRVLGTQTTLDRIGLLPGQRVLEIGPGPGRLLIPAAHRVLPGGQVVGLEIQLEMLERLQARATREGISNLSVVVGDATLPYFPPASFDVIYFCTALGEIPDRPAALRCCYDALAPGGRLSLTELFPDPHYQSRSTLRQLAKAAGFRQQTVSGPWYFFTANFVK